ncbi:MAG: creatininase family protein [Chloroflexi bacterium]|nr:creatininase family protein [Chloroflexota bacterium]
MPIERFLAHLSWMQIRDLPKDPGVVILPVGAVEQHGPHLPTLTDTLLVTQVLNHTLAHLPDEVQAWALPAVNYGKSNEHLGFPGTMSLSAATLTAVLHELAASVKQAGFRRLAFFNGHGGNVAVLDAAARDIRATLGLHTFCLHPALYCDPPFPTTPEEQRFGIHAGEIETSLVLALAPELVRMEQAVRHYPDFPSDVAPLFMFGQASAAWLTRDWSPTGVFGDATAASAEKGAALLATATAKLARLIAAISRFEVAHG